MTPPPPDSTDWRLRALAYVGAVNADTDSEKQAAGNRRLLDAPHEALVEPMKETPQSMRTRRRMAGVGTCARRTADPR